MKKTFYTGLTVALIAFSGCTGNAPTAPQAQSSATKNCAIPSGHNLDSAIAQGVATIKTCSHLYSDVMSALMDIAAEKKSPENGRKLMGVVQEAISSYSVPADAAKAEYNRYFSPDFVSLPSYRASIKSQCKNYDKIIANADKELLDKKKGIQSIVGDSAKFGQIAYQYEMFKNSLEVTCDDYRKDI